MSFDVSRMRKPRVRSLILGLGLGLAATLHAPASRAEPEPPIQSPQDAACRNVARSQVFSAPDPQNLGLREIGRRIYMACMSRVTKPKRPVRSKARVVKKRRR